MNQSDKESFVRWQQVTMAQFGHMNNLIITLAVALLAYYANLLIGNEFKDLVPRFLIKGALLLLLVSTTAGLVCGLYRLANARATTQVVKNRNEEPEKATILRAASEIQGRMSQVAFEIQVVLFGLGAATGMAAVYWQFG